jgi:hypothetical protein
MSATFFEKVEKLDLVIKNGPSKCEYGRDLFSLLSDDALTEYFFRNLADPNWLGLLVNEGRFADPPGLIRNEREGTVGFARWSEGEFLRKIAAELPDLVTDVATKLPPTENAVVHDTILEIALVVPAAQRTKLVPKIVEAIRSPYHLGLAYKIGPFISTLAKERNAVAALEVAGEALTIVEPRASVRDDTMSPSSVSEPRGRFSQWEYEQILAKIVPDLVDVAGQDALNLFCDLLDRSVLFSERGGANRRPEDFSYIWRPAVEEHQQNLNMGVKHLLVSGVRDAAERLGNRDVESAAAVVRELDRRGESWQIFRRIGLHVLRVLHLSLPNQIRKSLLDRLLFNSVEFRHEYFLLQQQCFGGLSSADRATVLGWVEEGPPNLELIMKRWSEAAGRPATSEDKENYVRAWKRDYLAPLEKFLDGRWKDIYSDLCKERQPHHPEFVTYHEGGAWGPTAPRTRTELAELSVADLVSYLNEWKAIDVSIHAPSPEGLGRELTAAVSANPDKYSGELARFKELQEPTYVHAVVNGFYDALKQGRTFNWSAVLDLCTWAVAQRDEIPDRKVVHFEMDPGWSWTKTTVLRLLNEGLAGKQNPIPFDLRTSVWPGINASTSHPEPTVEQERKYFEGFVTKTADEVRQKRGGFDPFTNSMNSARGIALESVVRYALWVRDNFQKLGDKDTVKRGFDAMPEVSRVLDLHLDPQVDPSISIRSVYGQRAPWLHLLDERWARENASRIFSRENPELWHAAWDAHVLYCAPYDNVFEWLRDEYEYAVGQVGNHDHGWNEPNDPDDALARHLMSFYWRGKVELDSNIMRNFYRRAGARLSSYTLNFIGTSLRNTAENISDKVLDRLKALWISRLEEARQEPKRGAEGMKEFGWWFASGKFEIEWSLRQLLDALELGGAAEPDHLVAERLVETAKTVPDASVRALKMMIEGDVKNWGVLGWSEKAKEIIRTARSSGNASAKSTAEDLINFLGSKGLFDFGALLKEPVG